MKLSTFTLGAFAASAVTSLMIEERDIPGVVQFQLHKKTSNSLHKLKSKRATGAYPTPYENFERLGIYYFVTIEVGNPPQSIQVVFDTGSSDLVLETPSSDICTASVDNPCTMFGSYSANASSTYQYLDSNLKIHYTGGDGATGDDALEVVSIAGITVKDLQIGIMYNTTLVVGILGVSYVDQEGQTNPYDNLPILLVKQGIIASRAFSLYTNDDKSVGGSVVFGGIDTDKYCGSLTFIDLVASNSTKEPGKIVDFSVNLPGISGTSGTGAPIAFTDGSVSQRVLLDSGTTVCFLPTALVQSIWDYFGVVTSPDDPDTPYIPCVAATSSETVNFEFSGVTIAVPIGQFIYDPSTYAPTDAGGDCAFGIYKATDDFIIGDNVLSSMYVVHDLDNYQLAVAPAIYNAVGSNILPIGFGPDAVPRVSGLPCSGTTTPTSSSTSTSSTSTITAPTSSGISTSITLSGTATAPSTGVTASRSTTSTASTSSPTGSGGNGGTGGAGGSGGAGSSGGSGGSGGKGSSGSSGSSGSIGTHSNDASISMHFAPYVSTSILAIVLALYV